MLIIPWGEVPPTAQMRQAGFAKRVKAGDICRHYGTKAWARVDKVLLQGDGTAELELTDIQTNEAKHWATYHIDWFIAAEDVN